MEKEYREFTGEQIKETCEAHEKWIASGGKEGERADFSNADLKNARLNDVNLEKSEPQRRTAQWCVFKIRKPQRSVAGIRRLEVRTGN